MTKNENSGRRKRSFLWLAVFIGLALVVVSPPGLKLLLIPLDRGDDLESDFGDVIFVFGSGMLSYDNEYSSTLERIDRAAEIFRSRPLPVIISEGNLTDTTEFKRLVLQRLERMTDTLVPVVFDLESTNTTGNCRKAAEMARKHRYNEMILVTSLYHQGRVDMIAGRLIPVEYRIAGMENAGRYEMKNIRDWNWSRKRVIREYLAMVKDFILVQLN